MKTLGVLNQCVDKLTTDLIAIQNEIAQLERVGYPGVTETVRLKFLSHKLKSVESRLIMAEKLQEAELRKPDR